MAMTCEKAFAVLASPTASEADKAAAQAFVEDAANGCDVNGGLGSGGGGGGGGPPHPPGHP